VKKYREGKMKSTPKGELKVLKSLSRKYLPCRVLYLNEMSIENIFNLTYF